MIVEGLSNAEVRTLIDNGKSIGDVNAYVKIPVAKLDEVVTNTEGFILAPGFEKPLREYTHFRETLNKKYAYVPVGWTSINDKSQKSCKEVMAFIKKYGKENLYFADELKDEEFFVYKETLEAMTKTELKAWYEANKMEVADIDWNKPIGYNINLILKFLGLA